MSDNKKPAAKSTAAKTPKKDAPRHVEEITTPVNQVTPDMAALFARMEAMSAQMEAMQADHAKQISKYEDALAVARSQTVYSGFRTVAGAVFIEVPGRLIINKKENGEGYDLENISTVRVTKNGNRVVALDAEQIGAFRAWIKSAGIDLADQEAVANIAAALPLFKGKDTAAGGKTTTAKLSPELLAKLDSLTPEQLTAALLGSK